MAVATLFATAAVMGIVPGMTAEAGCWSLNKRVVGVTAQAVRRCMAANQCEVR
jgi:hypothetical protein